MTLKIPHRRASRPQRQMRAFDGRYDCFGTKMTAPEIESVQDQSMDTGCDEEERMEQQPGGTQRTSRSWPSTGQPREAAFCWVFSNTPRIRSPCTTSVPARRHSSTCLRCATDCRQSGSPRSAAAPASSPSAEDADTPVTVLRWRRREGVTTLLRSAPAARPARSRSSLPTDRRAGMADRTRG